MNSIDPNIKSFSGNQNLYVIIGSIGSRVLGTNLQIVPHPGNGNPYILVRFAALDINNPTANFPHFTERDGEAEFLYGAGAFPGKRLNRLAIPTVDGQVTGRTQFLAAGDKFDLWKPIGEWLMEQTIKGGFTPTITDFSQLVRGAFETAPLDEQLKSVLVLPSLEGEEPTTIAPATEEPEGGEAAE